MISIDESRQSFKVEEPKTGRYKKKERGSFTSLEENLF
jgi:hypothetical protein